MFNCISLWGKAMLCVKLYDSWVNASVPVDMQVRDENSLFDLVFPSHPLFFVGRLFVCGKVLVFVQSFRIFFLFSHHASTNATMVFKANCDVHYFHCCFILFRLFSSCIDWQAKALLSFSAVTFAPSSRCLLLSVNLQSVLTTFRRLVDAWLQCCVVLFSLHSIEE